MTFLPPVDPLALLIPWLSSNLDVTSVADLPNDLQLRVKSKPVVQVTHVNGADDVPTLAELTIDFDYYGLKNPADLDASRAALSDTARRGHTLIRYALRNTVLTAGSQRAVVYTVRPQTLPRIDDTYDDPNVARFLSSYVIGFKAQPGA